MPDEKLFLAGRALPTGGFIVGCTAGDVRGEGKVTWCEVIYDSVYYPQAPVEPVLTLPEKLLQGATLQRKAEFQAGRHAAYHALARAGAPSCYVAGSGGSMPQWPDGWHGSITHSAGRALAVAAPAYAGSALGVDCEKYAPAVAAEIDSVVINTAEKACLLHSGVDYSLGVFIAFSAKESLYKALWPEVRHFFDFPAVELCSLEVKRQRFTLRLRETLTPFRVVGTEIHGRFCRDDDFVTTLVTVPPF